MSKKLHWFKAYGVEAEYMVVSADTLSVRPMVDELLHAVSGKYSGDVRYGSMEWSNELMTHVIEFKNTKPTASLKTIADLLHAQVKACNRLLEKYNARLLPTGAHPLMNPRREARIWPHGHNEIYRAYNRIFNCQGHGWSNLQSLHLNLPFFNDEEFGRLHAAVRLLLPVIAALSASTPIIGGKRTGLADTRLEYYRKNQRRIPSITGIVIPERAYSRQDYETMILQKIYRDIAPHDPQALLRREWLNSRGAIARFDRHALEIRIIDMQECPLSDIAIVSAVVAVLRLLTKERFASFDRQAAYPEQKLARIFLKVIKQGSAARIDDAGYLQLLGYTKKSVSARLLWQYLLEQSSVDAHWQEPLERILRRGNLSERITKALRGRYTSLAITNVYAKLADCLQENVLF